MSSIVTKIADFQLIITITAVILAWKWGDWKNWLKYYPTMLYFALCNLIYSSLSSGYPLWQLQSPLLKTTFSDLIISLIAFPAIILLYLPNFPGNLFSQFLYVGVWAILSAVAEVFALHLGYISYHNGWNFWLSLLFDLIMFPMLWLHHKKTALALFLSVIIAAALFFLCGIPWASIK